MLKSLLTSLRSSRAPRSQTTKLHLDHLEDRRVMSATVGPIEAPTISAVVWGDGSRQRSQVTDITVQFSKQVRLSNPSALPIEKAVSLHKRGAAGDVTLVIDASVPQDGFQTLTLHFTGKYAEKSNSVVDGLYDLAIDGSAISDGTVQLDGARNGIPGSTYFVKGTTANGFFRLFGDATGDGTTDQADYLMYRDAIAAAPSSSAIFDFDANKQMDQEDYLQFRNRLGGAP
ncbi:MAG: hypothetical protein ACJ8C4_13985 [Gemmataceae bacterium]